MKDAESLPVPGTTQTFAASRAVFRRLVRSPALWLFIVVYLVALILYIPVGGNGYGLLVLLSFMLYYVLAAILVFRLTAGAPSAAWEEAAMAPRARLWVQLGVITLFLVLYAALTVAIFSPESLPGLGPFLVQNNELTILLAFAGVPVVCLLPLVILRLLGVGFREMGLGRGYHAWRVAAIGCSVPACLLVVFLALGHFTPLALGKEVIQVALFTAIPEEVLFRGVLMTRLARLLGAQWGIALAVGIFALIHLATDLHQYGSLPLALVLMVLTQAAAGLLLITVFVRTRSLLSGVVLHTILDTFSNLISF
jgi:membrane protease YdiL (CAAX protease family)